MMARGQQAGRGLRPWEGAAVQGVWVWQEEPAQGWGKERSDCPVGRLLQNTKYREYRLFLGDPVEVWADPLG